jgi:hypothetical protein
MSLPSKRIYLVGLNTKIVGKTSPDQLSYAGAFVPKSLTLRELAVHCGQEGHPWMPSILDKGCRRFQQHANCAALLTLDIDGGLMIEEAIAHPFFAAHCGLAIETSSSCPELNKFRAVFPLHPSQVALSDYRTIKICNVYLQHLIQVADPSCKDASRFYFGAVGRSPFILDESACLPESFVSDALVWHTEQERIADLAYEEAQRRAARRRVEFGEPSERERFELVEQALACIPPRQPGSGNYEEWMRILAALVHEFGESDAIALVERVSPSIKNSTWNVPQKARSFSRGTGRPLTMGSVFHIAKDYGFRFPKREFSSEPSKRIVATGSNNRTAPLFEKLTYEEEVERVQKKLRSLTYTPTTELNQRFLGELPLPAPGTIAAISSACKTGKTESLKELIAKHRAAYPDAKIFMIGYRNVLLKQSAKRLGITHIQDLRGKGYRATQATREMAFCLDSLDKIDLDNIPPNSLIILDEGDATLKHGLEGGTLKGRQAEILSLFQKTLNKVLGDGGAVLLMEDNLTDLPIDTLKSLTGNQYPVDLTVNHFKPSKWDVSIGDGSKSGVTKRVVECLTIGERLMLVTSAQKYGEELDLIVRKEFNGTKKIVRLDSKTVELLHSLVDDPNAWLKDAGIDLLICSPTAESGFNITIDVFDRVIGYFASSETRSQIQLLERYRPDVPREIFCSKFCNFGDGNGRSPLPANILKDWKLLIKQSAMVNQIEPSLQADADANPDLSKRLERFKNPSEQQEVWNQAAANYRARINGSNSAMLERLTEALTDRGHEVTETKWEKDDRFKDLHKQARKEIDRGGAIKFSDAYAHGIALDDARATLNSGTASQDDRLVAYKRVLQDELPGAPLDDVDFVLKSIIENSGRFKRQTEFLFLCQNSDIASFLDKRAFESQLDKPFVMLRRFRHNRVKVDLMTGIFDTLMRIARSETYRESDELVQAVRAWAIKNSFEIRRVLGLNVSKEQTAIAIANKFLKKLGFETESIKHEGSGRNGEKRSRIWQVIDADCPHRQEILKALRLKWEREFSKVAYTILNTEEPLNKIVYATAEMQPDLERWLSPDSLKEIRQQWASAETEEEREIWRQVIPIAVLERAIA